MESKPKSKAKSKGADSKHQCIPRWCTTSEECRPYGETCTQHSDCTADSCCVILDLTNIAVSTPGAMLPMARIGKCNRPKAYCVGVCAISEPDWTGFTDDQAIAILQQRGTRPLVVERQMMDTYLESMRQK